MRHNVTNILLFFTAFNAFALAVSSHAYTAWSIRVRNAIQYEFFHREVNRRREERADEIAEAICRYLRPVALVLANGLATYVVYDAWR